MDEGGAPSDVLSDDRIEFTREELAIIDEFIKKHPEATRAEAERFCLGRKFVREKIEDCYVTYRRVVHEHGFEDVTIADVLPELRTQKLYLPGSRDKQGAALFVINAGRHVPGEFPPEDTLRLAFYMGEVLTASPKTQKIGVTIISNMDGMEWATFDADFQQRIINLFVGSIPARVKHILLYNCPWWVSMMVRIVAPFLKQKMRERIHICADGDLLEFIDADQLPQDLGGTLPYSHGAFIRRQMALVPAADVLHEGMASAFRGRRGAGAKKDDAGAMAPPRSPSMASARERREELLVSEAVAAALNKEREQLLVELDKRIEERIAQLEARQRPPADFDVLRLLRSRSARLGLDVGLGRGGAAVLGPNMARARRRRRSGPVAERTGENYDAERLKHRIAASMRKDAVRSASPSKLALPEDAGSASPLSLASPAPPTDVQPIPQIPRPAADVPDDTMDA